MPKTKNTKYIEECIVGNTVHNASSEFYIHTIAVGAVT